MEGCTAQELVSDSRPIARLYRSTTGPAESTMGVVREVQTLPGTIVYEEKEPFYLCSKGGAGPCHGQLINR